MSLLTNLVAYWKFNEGSGTSLGDATGNGNTGTLANSPTWTTGVGPENGGLTFSSASSQYVTVGTPADLNITGTFSVMWWFKTTTTAIEFFWDKASYQSWVQTANIHSRINQNIQSVSSPTVNDGALHCCIFVCDGTNTYNYVDNASSGLVANANPSDSSANTFYFGRRSTGNYFDGSIGSAAIWSRAVTSTEATQLYNSGSGYPYSSWGGGSTHGLFRSNNLTGLGSGGPFFQNPLSRSILGWRKSASGLLVPRKPKLVLA